MRGKKKTKAKGNRTRRQLPPGMTYAEALAMQKRQLETIREAAVSDTARLQAEDTTTRNMWLMIISLSDAYGFGPKRIDRFISSFNENVAEFARMQEQNGEEYAFEKLRQRAEKVTGSKIAYVSDEEYEQARKAAEGKEIP